VNNDKDLLGGILDQEAAKNTVDELGHEVAGALGELLRQADRAFTDTLDEFGRALAQDEADFQREHKKESR
jgi:hypothetical protein